MMKPRVQPHEGRARRVWPRPCLGAGEGGRVLTDVVASLVLKCVARVDGKVNAAGEKESVCVRRGENPETRRRTEGGP